VKFEPPLMSLKIDINFGQKLISIMKSSTQESFEKLWDNLPSIHHPTCKVWELWRPGAAKINSIANCIIFLNILVQAWLS